MRRRTVLAMGALALVAGCAHPASPSPDALSLVVPDASGDGFARALAALLRGHRLVRNVEISSHVDARTAIARFAAAGRPGDLLVADSTLLGIAAMNHAVPLVGRTAPLARLAGEWEMLVTPADSGLRTFDQFAAALLRDPVRLRAAGAADGGPDHVLYGLTAQGLGVDARVLSYTSYGSRRQAVGAMLDGQAMIGFGAQREMSGYVRAGRLRPLAISAPERVAGVDAPTLIESGVRLVYADWSGLVGSRMLAEPEREAMVGLCRVIADSAGWRRICARNGWAPMYLAGEEFGQWLADETGRTRRVLRDLGLS